MLTGSGVTGISEAAGEGCQAELVKFDIQASESA